MKTQKEKDGKIWKRMQFKGNKVWTVVDRDGNPVVENNKVLIKYQLDQDYEYQVFKKNVFPIDQKHLPDKSCIGKSLPARRLGKKADPELRFDPNTESSEADNVIRIYADGASSGNPGPSGIGVVLCFGKHKKEISKYIGNATNNVAELEAIRTGLSAITNKNLPVRVFTDSSYAFGLLALGWKPRKNLELVKSIQKMIQKFSDLKLIKIKGHVGIEGNEKADLLARSALRNGTTHPTSDV